MSAATEMSVPVELPVDLYSREVFDNPLPAWKAIRDAGPVVRLQRGRWAIGRFSEIKPILKDWETFSSAGASSVNEIVNQALKGGVLRTDPPEHAALREIIMRPLTPTRLRELRPRIAAIADQLVERLCSNGGFDAATDLAEHLPLTVVSELVGLPDDGKAEMLLWANASFNANSPIECPLSAEALPRMKEAMAYMGAPELPQRLRSGGWAAELYESCQRGEISETCFRQLLPAYVFPSLDTTILATSSLVWLFANHPEQWTKLREKPALVARAVSEGLRLEGPIRQLTRVTTRETEVAGVRIPRDVRVHLMIGAANRDERRYANPDQFDIERDNADHLSFGHDRHICAGMNLARMEMTCLTEALLKRVKRFEVVREERAYSVLRGFAKLDVKVH